jgi:hypothetical protein
MAIERLPLVPVHHWYVELYEAPVHITTELELKESG